MLANDFDRSVRSIQTAASLSALTWPAYLLASAALSFVAAACSSDVSPMPQPTGPAVTSPPAPSMTATSAGAGASGARPTTPNVSGGAGASAVAPPAGSAADKPSAGTGTPATAGRGAPVAAAGTAGASGGAQSADSARSLPPVTSLDMNGPFEVTVDQQGGASSWVFRPKELGKDGAKHPVFIFGNGATATPMSYTRQMSQIASHGIIVVDPTSSMVTPADLKAALDWIIGENDKMGSIYYQKLNGKYAMGGHSLGSLSTFDAEASESRLTTTVHVAGGSFDMMGSSKVKTPTAYICGDTDFARPNCEMDFATVGAQPTYFTVMTGSDHIAAVTNGVSAMIGWLRWQLAGETERKAMFTGPDGEFFQGKWVSQTKNWN